MLVLVMMSVGAQGLLHDHDGSRFRDATGSSIREDDDGKFWYLREKRKGPCAGIMSRQFVGLSLFYVHCFIGIALFGHASIRQRVGYVTYLLTRTVAYSTRSLRIQTRPGQIP